MLDNHLNQRIKNILFVDIKTVSQSDSYQNLSPDLQKFWEKKFSYQRDENLTIEDHYMQQASLQAEFGKVITIGVGYFYLDEFQKTALRVKAITGPDEKDILLSFKSLVDTKFNNVAMCAHNGKEFDYPYLCRRMVIHGIELPLTLNLLYKKPWEVPHLDTLEMWKFGDRKHKTSLSLLATLLNIPYAGERLEGHEVNRIYHEEQDLDRIVQGCVRDIEILAKLFLQLNQIPINLDNHIYRVD
ncbi:MAG TPA: 3'-5' exonuclease [Microscillaceae bacterium]|nr:3'-5' exonuclease [Microscillaceae bacterium]